MLSSVILCVPIAICITTTLQNTNLLAISMFFNNHIQLFILEAMCAQCVIHCKLKIWNLLTKKRAEVVILSHEGYSGGTIARKLKITLCATQEVIHFVLSKSCYISCTNVYT